MLPLVALSSSKSGDVSKGTILKEAQISASRNSHRLLIHSAA
jgi:hypothetical protein